MAKKKNPTRGMGFSVGLGWTTSYSAQLELTPPTNPTTITAIADDGTEDVYTLVGSAWQPPTGVYDRLLFVSNTYRLVHKDQSFHEFDTAGLLTRIVDASGNALVITRTHGAMTRVTDASGRYLDFNITNGALTSVVDPFEPGSCHRSVKTSHDRSLQKQPG